MSGRTNLLAAVAIATLLAAPLPACSETVGFLSLDIEVPSWSPPISCEADPRRATQVRLVARCADETVEGVYAIDAGAVSLGDVPIGECELTVSAVNAHGRVVLSGSALATIAAGENDAVSISLVEQPCDVTCDRDGDGLADDDELALRLDPEQADSDDDKLDDGLELMQCCSDPRVAGANKCKLLIQDVLPPVGPVGQPVVIRTTAELDQPTVRLGGAPFQVAIADTSTIFGTVGPGAVLGEVVVEDGGATATAGGLFNVLRNPAQTIFEIDQLAGATSGVMQEFVDIITATTTTFVLGRATSSAGAAGTPQAVIDVVKREDDSYSRVAVPAKGTPVALALASGRVAALLRDGGTARVVVFRENASGIGTVSTVNVTANQQATALALEPAREAGLVLFRSGIARISLAGGDVAPTIVAAKAPDASAGATTPSGPDALGEADGCTGLAYDAAHDAAYLACNYPASLCRGRPCPLRGALLRLASVEKCLPLGNSNPPANKPLGGCWRTYIAGGLSALRGSPVVDGGSGRVFVLTDSGLASAPLSGDGKLLQTLRPDLPFAPPRDTRSLRPLASNGKGVIFIANGTTVLRARPGAPADEVVRGFLASADGAVATVLSASLDGNALDIGALSTIAPTLSTVCLARCPTCACK